MRPFNIRTSLLLVTAIFRTCMGGYDTTRLCNKELEILFTADPSIRNDSRYQCGRSYTPALPATIPITVTLERCMQEEPGWHRSDVKTLSQWIGPLVGFLLPALVFTLVIPRLHRVSRREEEFGRHMARSIGWLAIAFIGILIDALLWIIICLGLVGLLVVGAIDESLKDWLIMRRLEQELHASQRGIPGEGPSFNARQACYALAVILVGSFEPDHGGLREKVQAIVQSVNPHSFVYPHISEDSTELSLLNPHIPDLPDYRYVNDIERQTLLDEFAAQRDEFVNNPANTGVEFVFRRPRIPTCTNLGSQDRHDENKLEQLFAHQASFGTQVGAPVVFYLGAAIYAILDASSKLGENDTAHAIAFGEWYSVLIIAANCSCAVLGIGNSRVLESIFGIPIEYDGNRQEFIVFENTGGYRASWLWDRARCHRSWIQDAKYGNDNVSTAVRHTSESLWIPFFACVIAIFLILTVCFLAGTICYLTPMVGFGCRSVTVLVYAVSQVTLIILWFPHSRTQRRSMPLHVMAAFVIGVGMFASIGGTIMQLSGVYRNCICAAGLRYSFRWVGGKVQISSDTQSHRDSGSKYVNLGITGVIFIGVVSVCSWGYYMRMKAKCRLLIKAISSS